MAIKEAGTLRRVGETRLTGKNQVTLPAAGVRELGLERGDRFLVGIEDDRTVVLVRKPRKWAEEMAGLLFRRIEDPAGPVHGYCSVVSAAELLVRPIRAGSAQMTNIHEFLTSYPNFTALPVDLIVAVQAANVRAATNLGVPDSIIVASALLAGCDAVVSNDARWIRRCAPLYPRFQWVHLSALL